MTRNHRARPAKRRPNALAVAGVSEVDWKDTDLLRRFISDRGKIRSRWVTGLTPRQQRQVATAIRNAREMALLPYPNARRG
ncbi:small subunit ribosomal protein S18 [Amycolatopsis arida]|uniref:Small ribosomal subunit protein bS18 n=1 Tax=Amycolatopsis arida TaxID=587909 RepID=A0A1I5ZPL6_9PSEU|nr:30S ribosomal protein S18 [Amycolatopsis arida]TDX89265.1 small subunit ribosomal protein S18 [Amycolatopsis arida]SFQ58439.1 small subunit ribosomal protein S18 [Amycolatopsis arida]